MHDVCTSTSRSSISRLVLSLLIRQYKSSIVSVSPFLIISQSDLANLDFVHAFLLPGTAGMISALFLVLGIFSGCLFSLILGKFMLIDSGAIIRNVAIDVAQNVARHGC